MPLDREKVVRLFKQIDSILDNSDLTPFEEQCLLTSLAMRRGFRRGITE